jgi:hypothetical protein
LQTVHPKRLKMNNLIQIIFIVKLLVNFSFCFVGSFNAESDTVFFLRIKDQSFDKSEKFNFESKEEFAYTAFNKDKPVIFQVHGYLENKDIKQHLDLSK